MVGARAPLQPGLWIPGRVAIQVVLLLSEKLSVEECRPMMQGGSLPLCSSFRLRCELADPTAPNELARPTGYYPLSAWLPVHHAAPSSTSQLASWAS